VTRSGGRVVPAVHGRRELRPDPPFETGLSRHLLEAYGPDGLVELYGRFVAGTGEVDGLLRRAIWRALARRCGPGLIVDPGARFRHLETFTIGPGVFIGADAVVQGRVDGQCRIGKRAWIGPQCFLDARDLVIGESVAIGPGGRVLGSTHVGVPLDVPIMSTDLRISPVRIGASADIGVSAIILPGVRIGAGAVVGAGSVVTRNVRARAVVAGTPAKFVRWRDERPG
jgi:acetyltransferase-like isoleucine patch superfamily enzyme